MLRKSLEASVLGDEFFDGLICKEDADFLLIARAFRLKDSAHSKGGVPNLHTFAEAIGFRHVVVIRKTLRIKI